MKTHRLLCSPRINGQGVILIASIVKKIYKRVTDEAMIGGCTGNTMDNVRYNESFNKLGMAGIGCGGDNGDRIDNTFS